MKGAIIILALAPAIGLFVFAVIHRRRATWTKVLRLARLTGVHPLDIYEEITQTAALSGRSPAEIINDRLAALDHAAHIVTRRIKARRKVRKYN